MALLHGLAGRCYMSAWFSRCTVQVVLMGEVENPLKSAPEHQSEGTHPSHFVNPGYRGLDVFGYSKKPEGVKSSPVYQSRRAFHNL